MRIISRIFALVFLVCVGTGDVSADSFGYIPFVEIVIEPLDSDPDQVGVTEQDLRDAAELSLLRNNFRVVEPMTFPVHPLRIDLTTVKITDSSSYVFAIEVEFDRLGSTMDGSIYCRVWEKMAIGYMQSTRMREQMMTAVSSMVDDFSLDYLRAQQAMSE